jgi:hypothetical protein
MAWNAFRFSVTIELCAPKNDKFQKLAVIEKFTTCEVVLHFGSRFCGACVKHEKLIDKLRNYSVTEIPWLQLQFLMLYHYTLWSNADNGCSLSAMARTSVSHTFL